MTSRFDNPITHYRVGCFHVTYETIFALRKVEISWMTKHYSDFMWERHDSKIYYNELHFCSYNNGLYIQGKYMLIKTDCYWGSISSMFLSLGAMISHCFESPFLCRPFSLSPTDYFWGGFSTVNSCQVFIYSLIKVFNHIQLTKNDKWLMSRHRCYRL